MQSSQHKLSIRLSSLSRHSVRLFEWKICECGKVEKLSYRALFAPCSDRLAGMYLSYKLRNPANIILSRTEAFHKLLLVIVRPCPDTKVSISASRYTGGGGNGSDGGSDGGMLSIHVFVLHFERGWTCVLLMQRIHQHNIHTKTTIPIIMLCVWIEA